MPVAAVGLVGIEKVSSIAYLDAIFDCYEQRRVAVPVEPGGSAPEEHEFAERLTPAAGGGWFKRALAPIVEDGPAQVSFSSGTTGTPKAVQISHRALADVTQRLIEAMAIDATIREYVGVPVTYSFGLARARVTAAVGGEAYLPPRGFDPMEFAAMLDAGEVNALSAVPTLLRVLIQNPDLIGRKTGRKLQWLEIGSQPMSAEDKKAIRRMFPAARIVMHYGLTEASRTTFLDVQEATDAQLETVGRPTGSAEVRIDGAGRICIRGPHVADGLLKPEGLEPIVDGEGWLVTNDLGEVDAEGFLHFLGRDDHLLNVGGIKVPAELFEARLAALVGADAAHVAVAGIEDALRGQVVMVAHLSSVAVGPLSEHARATGTGFGLAAADVVLIEVDAIPRTDTGKVQRKQLAEGRTAPVRAAAPAPVAEAAAAASPAAAIPAGMTAKEAEIARIWGEALGVSSISRDDSFFDIGGDSLSAITVALRAEQHGMPKDVMQLMFEGRTVAQIAALIGGEAPAEGLERSRRAVLADAINATRGVLVLMVIMNHWWHFFVEKMGSVGRHIYPVGQMLLQMGTPGFAMVFGIGVSYFYMPAFERSPERIGKRVRGNLMVLGVGLLLLAALRAGRLQADGLGFGDIWPEQLFFSVVLSYFLLIPLIPLILRLVRLTPRTILNCLTMGALGIALLLGCQDWFEIHYTGFLNLARLMVVSPYSVPAMLGAVGIGMAIGHWLRSNPDNRDLKGQAVQTGILLAIAGAVFLEFTGGFWAHPRGPHLFLFYAGLLLIGFTFLLTLIERAWLPRLLRVLMLLGLLSFPAFIAHELVIPAKDILHWLGLPYPVALGGPLALFIAGTGYAMLRLNRIYFGGGTKTPDREVPAETVEAF
ncbi:AMP-binding protein [Sphingomonas sp.]|uniref:AMP-binding protein n=1 Tax=Sphingomonas sp. TaxID=28214 RepID=UPI001B1796A9|nr:AMP-binding protein [Sphingomonas sp.]MBO9712330.1 AMP-binding protein [Sphingomonas sp.]